MSGHENIFVIISLIRIRRALTVQGEIRFRSLLGFQGLSFYAVTTNVDDHFPKIAELANVLANLTWLERLLALALLYYAL